MGAYVYFDSRTQESSDPELNIKVNVKSDVANDDETMIEKVMIEEKVVNGEINNKNINNNMEKPSKFVEYSSSVITNATQNNGKALLFFHANWCPTCRAAEKDILANLEQIPDNLTIIKVDYDTENDLKKKYDITYQHTFVQVDQNGKVITQWNGGNLSEILNRVK